MKYYKLKQQNESKRSIPCKWKNDSLKRNGFVIDHKPETKCEPV